MVGLKEMSFKEKHALAQDSLVLHEAFISSFVRERLGDRAWRS